MSKAKQIVEALTGLTAPELAILQKYHIADEHGEIRMVDLIDPEDDARLRRLPLSPIIAPDVLSRLLNLDRTADKHILDWIFYTAGGGAKAFEASQEAVNIAKEWMLNNRMGDPAEGTVDTAYSYSSEAFEDFARQHSFASFKDMRKLGGKFGIGADYEPIEPMNEEQAEAEWVKEEPVFKASYFYADQDIAGDHTKPFGYFQQWPGRDGIYQVIDVTLESYNQFKEDKAALKFYDRWNKAKGLPRGLNIVFTSADGGTVSAQEVRSKVDDARRVADAVKIFLTLTTKQKDKIDEFNALNQQAKFKSDLGQYSTPEELVDAVGSFARALAKRRAQRNVQFHGKAKAPNTGYTKGPNEVIYDDELMTVVIPASAAAAVAKGWQKWCIANRTNFDSYFDSGNRSNLYWDHPSYSKTSSLGVFAFWTFKKPMTAMVDDPNHPHGSPSTYARNQALAGFFRFSCKDPVSISAVEWTDKLNSPDQYEQVDIAKVEKELAAVDPGAVESFHRSIEEVKAWIMQHKPGKDIELAPALEHMARRLVAMMLGEAPDTVERLRL